MLSHQKSDMIKLFTSILVLTCFFAYGQTKKVLFLGNSGTYVNNLPQITAEIAHSMGDTLIYDSNTPGGYSLQEHSTNNTSLDNIMHGNWDFVILQGSNLLSLPISKVKVEVFPYAHYLDSVINVYNPCGETMFFMTWGKKNGDVSTCATWSPVCTYEGMDNLIRLRYMMMADSNKAVVSPVGAVWRYIRQHYPSIELYVADETHPSQAGSYAAGCCFYTTVFRKDPSLIPYDFVLSPTVAENIRTAVKLVVYDSLLTWHIGEYDLVSDFNYTQLGGYTFQFSSQSQNETGHFWDFGSVIDTSANPSFTFPDSGTYPVQLTSFNQCDTLISIQTISVSVHPTGIDETDMPEKLIIYPNPANNSVFLNQKSITGISINIYNLYGGNIIEIDHLSSNEIDISSLETGFYVVKIIKGRDTLTKKLVIQK